MVSANPGEFLFRVSLCLNACVMVLHYPYGTRKNQPVHLWYGASLGVPMKNVLYVTSLSQHPAGVYIPGEEYIVPRGGFRLYLGKVPRYFAERFAKAVTGTDLSTAAILFQWKLFNAI